MSDRNNKGATRLALQVMAAAAIAGSSASPGAAGSGCGGDGGMMLRLPAAALAASLASSGLAHDGILPMGEHAGILADALKRSGIATCASGQRCSGSASLEVDDCGIAPVVTLRTSSIALSQRWDFSSGEPRPASPVVIAEA